MIPDLVIFDCDGVLVDSEPPFNDVLAKNLTRHGLVLTTEEAMATFIGKAMTDVARLAREMGAEFGVSDHDWIDAVYTEGYARLTKGVEVIPGIKDVLDKLEQNGLPYCVASNGSQHKMDITLGVTGLAPRFQGRRYSAHELGVSKPDPGLFLIAAREMGASPERSVVVEDSASGALAAKRAGMQCFGYASHSGPALAEHGAILFENMTDLPQLWGLLE